MASIKPSKKARFLRGFWSLALAQVLIFIALGTGFCILVKTAPSHIARVTPESGENGGSAGERSTGFMEEEAAVMFGAATIASTLITALLAVLAIFSWVGIKEIVEEKVRESIEPFQRRDQADMMVRVGTLHGLLSELSLGSRKAKETFRAHSLVYLRKAYRDLVALSPVHVSPEYAVPALNNFAYFLALKGDKKDANEALQLAAKFRELNVAGLGPVYLCTYGFLIGTYARSTADIHPAELRELIVLTEGLLKDEQNKDDANRNLPLLRDLLKQLEAETAAPERPAVLFKRWLNSLWP